jgi:hypothetical protein
MREDIERDRLASKISAVALTLFGLYLVIVPIVVPSFGWNGLVEKFGETRILTMLIGFLFLYFSALAREKDRLRMVTSEIVQGLNRAIHGADVKSQREAVGLLLDGLKSPNPKLRDISLRQLRRLTGADPGEDYESWRAWWKVNGDRFTPVVQSAPTGETAEPLT